MTIIADILLVAGAFGAAIYCYVLAGRLKKFTTLETGMGGAIAVLSAQVDDMTRALEKARVAAIGSSDGLTGLTTRAEAAAARLEILIASLHDLPQAPPVPTADLAAGSATEPAEEERRLRFVRRRGQTNDLEAAE